MDPSREIGKDFERPIILTSREFNKMIDSQKKATEEMHKMIEEMHKMNEIMTVSTKQCKELLIEFGNLKSENEEQRVKIITLTEKVDSLNLSIQNSQNNESISTKKIADLVGEVKDLKSDKEGLQTTIKNLQIAKLPTNSLQDPNSSRSSMSTESNLPNIVIDLTNNEDEKPQIPNVVQTDNSTTKVVQVVDNMKKISPCDLLFNCCIPLNEKALYVSYVWAH